MARKPPTTGAVAYVEEEVSAFIHARIRGEEWKPGPPPEHPTLIRPAEARRLTGLSNFMLWLLEKQGRFPKRIKLTTATDAPAA